MATVVFYEKPGCINNTKQKQLLEQVGHRVEARNLLTETWDAARLLMFFRDLPVAEWFNRSAPRVKSGEIIPEQVGAKEALALMVADPLLIRRPLMQVGNACRTGFDINAVRDWIGLGPALTPPAQNLEKCPRDHHAGACGEPG